MFKIRMAGLTAELNNRYMFVKEQCHEYEVSSDMPSDMAVAASEEDIRLELSHEGTLQDAGYAESVCLYREIAKKLHGFDAFLMHGAVIGFEGKAYAFLAQSGTGKTTHIRLWRRYLKDGVLPINGDKPILRFENGVLTAYGTPWAGKEGWQRNMGLPLAGVCLLSRGTENRIARVAPEDALSGLLRQIYVPRDPMAAMATMAQIDKMTKEVPIYMLSCDMTEEAVQTSFEAMTGLSYQQSKGKYE